MTSIIYTKSFGAPPLDRREVLRYAGVRGEVPEIEALLDECLEQSLDIFTYKVCYRELDICDMGERLDLGFTVADSCSLKKNLAGCHGVIVFAASVGAGIDRLIARYSSLSPARALMLGAIGTERVESLCDEFYRVISDEKRGIGEIVCPRFSPGYGDLALDMQRDIFALLDCPRKIGVSLSDTLLMSPSKSVTAIIGIRREK